MHSPEVATSLRTLEIDATAIAAIAALRGSPDAEVLAHATAEGRALVTENVRDFAQIAQEWMAAGRDHGGLVFTSPQRFYRGHPGYQRGLGAALVELSERPPAGASWIWWL